MASIVASIDISRSPDDVFAYVTDPNRLPEWQESVVRAESSQTPAQVGTRAQVTRRIGPLDEGARSRVTIELDLQGRGIGRLLLPLVVRRKAEHEMPRNMQLLKERLE